MRRAIARLFEKFFVAFRLRSAGKWVMYGLVVGIVSGLGAAAFFYALQWAEFQTFENLVNLEVPQPAGERLFTKENSGAEKEPPIRWLFFVLPIVGGLLSGLIVYTFAPEAEGHGTDAMIEAFHHKQGQIRGRVPFVKALATIITLASGGSAGREGPIAQIGAGFGSWLGRTLKLNAHDRRILLLAGTAGGLGAIFRAPLGGALTAIEVLYKEDMESEALIPSVISSVTAYAIFSSIFGYAKIFSIPNFVFRDPTELIFYATLGLICVPVGIFYIKFFYGIRDRFFRPMRIPRHFKPMIGGLGVGIIGLFLPQVLGGGWGQIQLALLGKISLGMLLLIMLGKILSTSFTISSGGSGGVFGPTLFIGGMLGGAFGLAANQLFPEIVTQPGAYVLVGMVAFFAGVANAPIGALLMICEMTGGYNLLPPLMLVSVIALLFTRRWSIYEKQVNDKFASPAHIGDLTMDILADMKVSQAIRTELSFLPIEASMRFAEFQKLIADTQQNYFPVFDQGRLVGALSLKHARSVIFDNSLADVVIVSDMMSQPVVTTPETDLHEALLQFMESGQSQILVVDPKDPDIILGYLRHEDVIGAYHSEILLRHKENRSGSTAEAKS